MYTSLRPYGLYLLYEVISSISSRKNCFTGNVNPGIFKLGQLAKYRENFSEFIVADIRISLKSKGCIYKVLNLNLDIIQNLKSKS